MSADRFDPSALADAQDPAPLLAALRAQGPVVRLDNGLWAVTGYDAAVEALRHPCCRSGPLALRFLASLPPGAARDEMAHRINFLDAPDHTRVRGLVAKAFTSRRVNELRPWIERTAREVLAPLAARGRFDLLREYAHQVPSLVISELLGVPAADRERLTAWSDAVAPLLSIEVPPEELEPALAAAEQLHAYLGALLDERRASPGEDLLSALLLAEEQGAQLSRPELLSLAATLYSAGHRTTRDLLANGVFTLLSRPAGLSVAGPDGAEASALVEEMLRFETPTLFVARVPVEAVTLGGVEVGAYEPLLVYLSAANRDPAVYDAPDEFRPGRGGRAALSFAYGAHYCLGGPLARSEAELMLGALARATPGLRLAQGASPRWRLRGPFRGLDALPVRAA